MEKIDSRLLSAAIKFLSEERDNGKFLSIYDMPRELVAMIGEAKMDITDYENIDELRSYMKSFVSPQLQNLMRIGDYDDGNSA